MELKHRSRTKLNFKGGYMQTKSLNKTYQRKYKPTLVKIIFLDIDGVLNNSLEVDDHLTANINGKL